MVDPASLVTAGLVIEVIGTPAPQGSKSFKGYRGGKPILVESCSAVKPWREAVVAAARAAMTAGNWATLNEPVAVTIEFYLRRPPSTPRGRTRPDRRPDLDKLVRSTLDALTTAGAYEDDARVVHIDPRRFTPRGRPGRPSRRAHSPVGRTGVR